MSTELANNVSNQQHVGVASEERNNDKLYMQNNLLTNDVSGDINFPIRYLLQSSNTYDIFTNLILFHGTLLFVPYYLYVICFVTNSIIYLIEKVVQHY